MPSLVETIKEQGLVLVADTSDESEQVSHANSMDIDRTYLMPTGVNGVMKASGVLRFHETIDL